MVRRAGSELTRAFPALVKVELGGIRFRVEYWHKPDMLNALTNVRYRG